jgi:predicted O-methyltransferase YrrM
MHWEKAEGYFNYQQFYQTVADNLQDGCIAVEVGSYKGRSILYLAEALQARGARVDLYAVDTFNGDEVKAGHVEGQILDEYLRNVYPMRDHITTIIQPSVQASMSFADGSLGFVFIDAAHDYANVCADIKAWRPKVRKGGMLAGHDYHHPPVYEAVRDTIGVVDVYPGTVWGIEI